MKKILISCLAATILASCGGKSSNEKEGDKKEENKQVSSEVNPDYQKGLELVAANNCMTCHNVDNAVTGPAYRDVANKYAGYPDTIIAHLATKIVNGGSGNWGEILMPAQSVSQADAEAMVKYILLLKK